MEVPMPDALIESLARIEVEETEPFGFEFDSASVTVIDLVVPDDDLPF